MIMIETLDFEGLKPALHGMRNPMNSWDKSDSSIHTDHYEQGIFKVGPKDKTLAMNLAANGPVHAKYRRMIMVWADIIAPLYWWKEFDTYRMGVEKNSCSTMHKIQEKEFGLEDFSHEHLITNQEALYKDCPQNLIGWGEAVPLNMLEVVITALNQCRKKYLVTKDKRWWWQMIQLLPSSYNQKRTAMMSYEALANMYEHRHDHKLDEWRGFCRWIEQLPNAELIVGGPLSHNDPVGEQGASGINLLFKTDYREGAK